MKTARKLGPTLILVAAIMAADSASAQIFRQHMPDDRPRLIAADAETPAAWRYTRSGWQDANQWTATAEIAPPPARRFDNLHPVVLAMLILTSALAALFWASNEWELAQVWGERQGSQNATAD